MKTCTSCEQANPDHAGFCHRCGIEFPEVSPETTQEVPQDEDQLLRTLIGSTQTLMFSFSKGWVFAPSDWYYMEQFKKFTGGPTPQFALTWHWPAFLVPPFLWFLYRKMYLYAAVYLVGPAIFVYFTGDPTVTFAWQVIAGASANYLYFWHIRDHLKRFREQLGPNHHISEELLQDSGGVQPYVILLAILLHVFVFFLILQGPQENGPPEQLGGSPPQNEEVF